MRKIERSMHQEKVQKSMKFLGGVMKEKSKQLTRFDVFNLGVGGAIGSGIFVMLGIGIAATGKSISLAVLVGCLYMLLAYVYHPVISSMFILPGGDYDAKAMLFGPKMVGINAYFTYMSGMTISAYGIALVEYLSMVFPSVAVYTNLIAVGIISIFFLSTIRGTKFVSKLINIMTVVLIGSLAVFIIFGIPKIQPGYFTAGDYFLNGGAGFITAIAIMSFACQGVTMGPISVMKETKNARKVTPSTILFICLTVGIIYALIGVVASGVLPIEEVANQNLAVVAKVIFPSWLYIIFILGGAVFAIATSMLGGIQMIRFPCEQVAEDGWMPEIFKSKTKTGYPWAIMLLFYVISVGPIIFGFSVEEIISLYMIPAMLFNVYLNVALIRLVREYPRQWETSILYVKPIIFNTICIISAVCALSVAFILFMGLTLTNMVICLIMIAICVGLSIFRLRNGAVKVEDLKERRYQIAKRAIEATGAEK